MRCPCEHFFGAFQVIAQVALGASPDFLGVVASAVLAVGVWPEMKDIRPCDVIAASKQGVESLATIGSPGEQVHTAWRANDVFVTNQTALLADDADLLPHDFIDAVVIAREDHVSCRGLFVSGFVFHSNALLSSFGGRNSRKQKIDHATEVSLGSTKCLLR